MHTGICKGLVLSYMHSGICEGVVLSFMRIFKYLLWCSAKFYVNIQVLWCGAKL